MSGNGTRGNRKLKLAILERYRSQRDFLDALQSSATSLEISESRLSRIITGHLKVRPEEKRLFAWKLQNPSSELFGEVE
jgi:hypothetical protein